MNQSSRGMIVTAALFGLLAGTPPAGAHALLDHATPSVGATIAAAPAALTLTFSEDIVPAFSTIRLAAPGGASVTLPKPQKVGADTLSVALPPRLAPGVYVVTWHVVSVDTHQTTGSFKFTIAP